jgi:integrase
MRLSQISTFAVVKHKQQRIQSGARVRENRELVVLKSLFNRCREGKLFEGENPVTSVKLLKEPRQRLHFLESQEETRLLAECAESLRTLILVGTNCGLRLKSEALTLRRDDMDVMRRTVTVQASYAKSGQTRTVSLNSVVLAALSRLPKISEFVFAKPNGKPYHAIRGFRGACHRAGFTGVTPHTLRHTFATRLVEN